MHNCFRPSVRFNVPQHAGPSGSEPLLPLRRRQLGKLVARRPHLPFPLLMSQRVDTPNVKLRSKAWCQDPKLRYGSPVHFGARGQVLINAAPGIIEWNLNPEPALQGRVKRSALGGPDIPAFSRPWKRTEAVSIGQVVERVVKAKDF